MDLSHIKGSAIEKGDKIHLLHFLQLIVMLCNSRQGLIDEIEKGMHDSDKISLTVSKGSNSARKVKTQNPY